MTVPYGIPFDRPWMKLQLKCPGAALQRCVCEPRLVQDHRLEKKAGSWRVLKRLLYYLSRRAVLARLRGCRR
jgi:hypothetical protein